MTHATTKCTQGNHIKQTSNTTSYKQETIKLADKGSGTDSSVAKDRLSDAGVLRFESHTGRMMGKSIPSLWRDNRPAINGLRPPEHHVGHYKMKQQNELLRVKQQMNLKYYTGVTKNTKQSDYTGVTEGY